MPVVAVVVEARLAPAVADAGCPVFVLERVVRPPHDPEAAYHVRKTGPIFQVN